MYYTVHSVQNTLANLLCMYQSSAEACNIMFSVHYVSVQWTVISLAPQSLSLRHVGRNFGSSLKFKSFVLAEQLASSLCLPRALTAALTL